MVSARSIRLVGLLIFVCVCSALAPSACESEVFARAEREPAAVLVAYGRVFEIDLTRRRVIRRGALHATAPSAARAPDGTVWGRSAPAAVAPAHESSDDHVPSVALPDTPYLVVHDGSRTLYATHTTVRSGTAGVSLVDTARGVALPTSLPVPGPATDIAVTGRAVYVASLPVDAGGVPRLSRFAVAEPGAPAHGPGQVLMDGLAVGSQFRLAAHGEALFVSCVTGRNVVSPVVLRLDADHVTATTRLDAHAPVTHVVGRPCIAGDRVLVPVLLAGDRSAIAALDRRDLSFAMLYHVDHPVSTVLAADDDTIVCVDSIATAGGEGLHLSFLDRASGKEVTRIQLLSLLERSMQ